MYIYLNILSYIYKYDNDYNLFKYKLISKDFYKAVKINNDIHKWIIN